MKTFKVSDARRKWGDLLRYVEQGEMISITRHGKTIAHLIPSETQERLERQGTVEEFLRRRDEGDKIQATLEEMLAWRHEGHRF